MTQKTPLYKMHQLLHAKLVPFAGWELPLFYKSVLQEHCACREKAALFDVSHMGEFWIEGERSALYLEYTLTQTFSDLPIGKARYSLLCYENGTIADDLIVYRLKEHTWLVVVNASNTEKDKRLFQDVLKTYQKDFPQVSFQDQSAQFAQLALQGPYSEKILKTIFSKDQIPQKRFSLKTLSQTSFGSLVLARTGYTGEDGFEIYLSPSHAPSFWNTLLDKGASFGLCPAGLGARDSLRLEMGYPLYGHEISERTTPFEAGLTWAVKLQKPFFIGKAALEEQKNKIQKKLCGLILERGSIGREQNKVFAQPNTQEPALGTLCSGTYSPSLKCPIATAYLPLKYAASSTPLWVQVRNQFRKAQVVSFPFLKKT